jgi:hypothetical protein
MQSIGVSSSMTEVHTDHQRQVFRFTADIQSRRRLGLTATLVREDGMEGEVFLTHWPKALRCTGGKRLNSKAISRLLIV